MAHYKPAPAPITDNVKNFYEAQDRARETTELFDTKLGLAYQNALLAQCGVDVGTPNERLVKDQLKGSTPAAAGKRKAIASAIATEMSNLLANKFAGADPMYATRLEEIVFGFTGDGIAEIVNRLEDDVKTESLRSAYKQTPVYQQETENREIRAASASAKLRDLDLGGKTAVVNYVEMSAEIEPSKVTADDMAVLLTVYRDAGKVDPKRLGKIFDRIKK